jgi:hypothetical protein
VAADRAALIRRTVRYLPVLLFGRPLHSGARYQPFFIVGSGRCGTTLLRAILQAHPAVHIPPENYGLVPAVRAYRRLARLPWNVLLRVVLTHFEFHPQWDAFELSLGALFRELVGLPQGQRHLAGVIDAVYRTHARAYQPGATRWGDKTPIHSLFLTELRAVFPDLRVVHVIRDGRDVVASFQRIRDYTVPRAARQWLDYVGAAQAFGARHAASYLEIRYERLVSRPRETVDDVTAFLGLSTDPRMLRHHELGLRLGDVERLPHLQGVERPIYTEAVGRWRHELDATQLAVVDRMLGPALARLGYSGR